MTVAKATRKAAIGRSFLSVPVGGIIVVVFVGLGGIVVGSEGVDGTPGIFCVVFILLHFLVSFTEIFIHSQSKMLTVTFIPIIILNLAPYHGRF